ncbi:MAG: hypothetical protein M1474_03120 [Candidatus Marsarchaeota archaeon]|nr:hypothetical protein [Candidatus Marsarchaeota archaeon]
MAETELNIDAYGTAFWSLASMLLLIIIALDSALYYIGKTSTPTNYGFAPHSSALLYATLFAFVVGFAFLLAAILSMKSRRAGPAISSMLSAILFIIDMAIGFVWTGFGALLASVSLVTLFFSYRSLTAPRKRGPGRPRIKR